MTQSSPVPLLAPSPEEGEHVLLPWLRRMREEQALWQDGYGVWHVFRYRDVQQISVDAAGFSSDQSRVNPAAAELAMGNLTLTDPPEHRRLRQLVSAAFTPHTVAGLENRIVEVTNDLLAGVDGEFDLTEVLAHPMPVIVIAELLGLPASDRAYFAQCADRLLAIHVDDPNDPELMVRFQAAMGALGDYLREHVRDRRSHPRTDLVTDLVTAEVDGSRLSDAEAVNFCTLLLSAGHITSTLLLGNAMLCLAEYPDAEARLRADPTLIPAAVEEVLRYRSPFAQVVRVTTREVQVGDWRIPADSYVMPWIVSANRDERAFTDADRFDLYRTPNNHIAFGSGAHFCLGAPLARLEARVALRILLEHFAELQLRPDTQLEFYGRGVFGVKAVPVTGRLT